MSDTREELTALMGLIREQVGILPVTQIIKALELARECYRSQLEEAKPDRVVELQAAIKQVKALRGALVDPARFGLPLI